jgi:hypothetical protein
MLCAAGNKLRWPGKIAIFFIQGRYTIKLRVIQSDQKVSVQLIIITIFSGSAAQRGLWPPRS